LISVEQGAICVRFERGEYKPVTAPMEATVHVAIGGTCPVCSGRSLERREACLGCCRSGPDR
jgi:hypothetical protein